MTVQLDQLFDPQINKPQRVTPVGAALVDTLTKEFGGGFAGSLDTTIWAATNTGTGSSAGTASSVLTLASGTSSGGYGAIASILPARFLYAASNLARGTFRLPALQNEYSVRQWGAINFGTKPNITDGFAFSYDDSSGLLSLITINSGVITNSVVSGNFNGDVSAYTVDTSQHLFEIVYQLVSVWFFVDGVLLHRFKPGSKVMTNTMQLAAGAIAYNTNATAASTSLEVWAFSISKMASADPSTRYTHINTATTTVVKMGGGSLLSVVINSPAGGGEYSYNL